VSLLLVTAYTSEETRRTVVYRVLDFAGLSQIAVPESVPIPPELVPGLNPIALLDASQKQLSEFTLAPSGQLVPPPSAFDHPRERLDDWIAKLMGNIRQFPFTVVGLVGLLTFVYAALSMMVEVEHSFNQVYNAPEGRSWVRRLTQYWTLLSLGPVLLLLSFGVTAAVRVWLEQTLHSGVGEKVSWAAPFIVTVVTALPLTTAMFMLIYSVVPNTRVQPGPALVGAVTAAVLWELGKNGFGELREAVRHAGAHPALPALDLPDVADRAGRLAARRVGAELPHRDGPGAHPGLPRDARARGRRDAPTCSSASRARG
jgi:hypothetical protein